MQPVMNQNWEVIWVFAYKIVSGLRPMPSFISDFTCSKSLRTCHVLCSCNDASFQSFCRNWHKLALKPVWNFQNSSEVFPRSFKCRISSRRLPSNHIGSLYLVNIIALKSEDLSVFKALPGQQVETRNICRSTFVGGEALLSEVRLPRQATKVAQTICRSKLHFWKLGHGEIGGSEASWLSKLGFCSPTIVLRYLVH